MNGTDNHAGKRIVEKLIEKYGCLPGAADGPVLPGFNPVTLAQAIMQEVERGGQYGWSKITVHMDMVDAVKLAQFLVAKAR